MWSRGIQSRSRHPPPCSEIHRGSASEVHMMTMATMLHNADQKFFSFSLRRLFLREEDLCRLRVLFRWASLPHWVLRLLLERGMSCYLYLLFLLTNWYKMIYIYMTRCTLHSTGTVNIFKVKLTFNVKYSMKRTTVHIVVINGLTWIWKGYIIELQSLKNQTRSFVKKKFLLSVVYLFLFTSCIG